MSACSECGDTKEPRPCGAKNCPFDKRVQPDEHTAMLLAAISVAAMCNTRESAAKQRIDKSSPYWTAAYGDVVAAVEREMALREKLVDQSAITAWVPVSERLPENTGKYLVVVGANYFITASDYKVWNGERTWEYAYVTHWMPLPSAPAETDSGSTQK
jgi:hypothetical protein